MAFKLCRHTSRRHNLAAIRTGIDAGKTHHHCVAINDAGCQLLSRRVRNNGPQLLELLADVLAGGDEVTWGNDRADSGTRARPAQCPRGLADRIRNR
ncbi:transposase [Streptomyces sp. NPDC052101]|uniref:IS110 family transposase n=1 Tax=Streptomyces sp. NPDC052101 TaxID=3155763 RepID=UPI00341D0C27